MNGGWRHWAFIQKYSFPIENFYEQSLEKLLVKFILGWLDEAKDMVDEDIEHLFEKTLSLLKTFMNSH